MVELHSIKLNNFRSYKGAHEFDFPSAPGLYFLCGETKSALTANGAGKSTFLDAIVWALYGRTARGLKAGEVITWGAVTCQVTLEMSVGHQRLKIKRSQKPNNLILTTDGIEKPVDQEELQKYIRLNYDAFMASVLKSQFGSSFFSLKPSEKLTLFSDIMALDFWLERSDRAAKAERKAELQISTLEAEINQARGKIEHLTEDIVALKKNEASHADKQEAHIVDLTHRKADLEEEKARQERLIKAARDKEEPLRGKARLAWNEAAELAALRDQVLERVTKLSEKHTQFVVEIDFMAKEIEKLRKLKTICPECDQKILPDHRANRLAGALSHLHELEYKRDIIGTQHRDRLTEMLNAKSDQEAKVSEARDLQGDLDDLVSHIRDLVRQLGEIGRQHADVVKQIKEVKTASNPYADMRRAKQVQLKALLKEVTDSTKDLEELEAKRAANGFWVKAFKRVRLFIIEQAFRTLEVEVNNSIAQLGMTDWQITFDVERENKSGGVTKGFVVFVKGPNNTEPVRWENWSGGETQRLQLAGDLGLANLIMQQAGLSNTIEFYDEPSTHLSPEGMMDLADMLHERAIGESKRIWIIDHASITNFGEFEAVIAARKDKHGNSTISYETG